MKLIYNRSALIEMTREQAIAILRYNSNVIHQTINGETDPNEVEALDIAIKALEQQPCETAIDTKEVFNILRRNYRGQSVSVDGYCVPANYREDIYDEIKALPPVTPTRRWIPVSESLPKENGLYQCTVILNDLPRTMELFYKNGKWLDNRRINMFDTYDIYGYGNTKEKHKLSYQELISEFEWNQVIIAWQPLPRPYEEKRGSENEVN